MPEGEHTPCKYSNSLRWTLVAETVSLTTQVEILSRLHSRVNVSLPSPLNEDDWSKLTHTLEAFAAAWEKSPYPPSLADFLPSVGSSIRTQLVPELINWIWNSAGKLDCAELWKIMAVMCRN